MLPVTQDAKYKTWLLEYVNAWRRIAKNGAISINRGRTAIIGAEWAASGTAVCSDGIRRLVSPQLRVARTSEAFANASSSPAIRDTRRSRTHFDNLYATKSLNGGSAPALLRRSRLYCPTMGKSGSPSADQSSGSNRYLCGLNQ